VGLTTTGELPVRRDGPHYHKTGSGVPMAIFVGGSLNNLLLVSSTGSTDDMRQKTYVISVGEIKCKIQIELN